MDIRFFNILTRQVDRFEPLVPGQVKKYSCGPTVYDFAHIGNFRSFLFADLLRRFLEASGLDVWHAMNITDVTGLTKIYNGNIVAVDQLTLSVAEGEVYGLLVPNGAGKTTTLRMILGWSKSTGA